MATWRRRGSISSKAANQIERRYGIELSLLDQRGSLELRDYLLRYALYFIVVSYTRLLVEEGDTAAQDFALADDFAVLDLYLKRAINRAASVARYQGIHGAAEFLSDLKAERIEMNAIVAEAKRERQHRSFPGHGGSGSDTPTKDLTNRL